ncbi:hypothetical protein ACH5RR_006287 [Cinchona calisaya]|uniref:Uncharacterized protein n=1 Tax=Cinchona calisaya TaxID=153742 RepID=A0ABD3ANL5_9GENT
MLVVAALLMSIEMNEIIDIEDGIIIGLIRLLGSSSRVSVAACNATFDQVCSYLACVNLVIVGLFLKLKFKQSTESKQFLRQEGGVLYIHRLFPHEAHTTIDEEGSAGFSLHLTLAIEVDPPLE